ncbi:uncharacterized protein ACNLHF_007966 isoform 1-T2 [Anomaloglossus baeobatrachus]|uniref:uncharacterized protein LOC142254902 n=1 Tax=Anomaloglossus baeobatrachus TaxID=238106 RepID=UPI003F50B781
MERLANKQHTPMEKTTELSFSVIRKRIQWQQYEFSTFFRTWKKKTKPTRRSRRGRRRLGNDLEITEKLRKTSTTISASTAHSLLDEGHPKSPYTHLLSKDNTDNSKFFSAYSSFLQVVVNILDDLKELHIVKTFTVHADSCTSYVESKKDIKRDTITENITSRIGLYTIPVITGLRLCNTTRNHNLKCSAVVPNRPLQSNYTLRFFIHQVLPLVTIRKTIPRVFPYSNFPCTHSFHLLDTSSLTSMECNTA